MLLHLHEWGDPDGPPLVCLHGVTAAGTRFRRLAERRLAGHRVLAPDLRGHGASGKEPPWQFGTLVDDVLETLDANGVGRAAFAGHSLGGRLVLELAASAPERLERAILLDPAIQLLPHVALDQAEGSRADAIYPSLEAAVAERLEANPQAPRAFVEEDIAAELAPARGGGLRPLYLRAAAVSIFGELAGPPPPPQTLAVPTLLIYAPEYGLVRAEQLAEYGAALGDRLRVVPVPGRHIVTWDAFAQVGDELGAFLSA